MEKMKHREFYTALLLASLSLLGVGCGGGKKSGSDAVAPQSPETEPEISSEQQGESQEKREGDGSKKLGNSEQNGLEGGPHSQGESQKDSSQDAGTQSNSGTSSVPVKTDVPTVSSPTHALEGTYLQVENRQARIVIGNGLLLTTNLEFPSPSGNGTRLTPAFPHGLKYRSKTDDYATVGTYNDGTSVFRNIEIRLRLYNNNQFLDVTLLPAVGDNASLPSVTINPSPEANTDRGTSDSLVNRLNDDMTGLLTNGFLIRIGCLGGVHRLPHCPPPPLPLPVPVPCPDPCEDGDNPNQLRILYRFERAP